MSESTWSNVTDVIRSGDDDLYSIAVALDQPVERVTKVLKEMTGGDLLYRWNDNGVTRFGVCRERKVA